MEDGDVRHYTEWTPRHINRSRVRNSKDVHHNTELTPSLLGRSMYKYEDESKETSTIMNLLGYGPVIRQKRIEALNEWDRLWNAHCFDGVASSITAGSKAQGLTCVFESDKDMIYVLPNTMCLEYGFDESTIPDHINVFKMNTQSCSAGYCRLLLERSASLDHPVIFNSLIDNGHGMILMSSTYFVEHLKNFYSSFRPAVQYPHAGPSLPWSLGPYRNDRVVAIHCNCRVILQKWASRTRHWPPPGIIEKVIAMRAFVTPIGFKGSEFNHVEWRICFNPAETELVNNLNDTQVKIYFILKMIVNDVLKPQTKEITSYILKNIVLWLAENNPQTLFYPESLFHWLHEGLDILRIAIFESQLPYHFIPERNLMAKRGHDVEQQRVLVRSITDMINEGPRMLLRLKKVRHAIVCHPEPLLWYSKRRTELELLKLEYTNRRLKCFKDENFMMYDFDIIGKALAVRMSEILLEVLRRMPFEGNSVNDLMVVREMMLS
ncbi:uncharacterized protein LOC127863309 isoform X2 [Dreissena polymorpha]|nr:uncharacterized protein LOC127863309 isoform X2 [Dreissena polymorpha]